MANEDKTNAPSPPIQEVDMSALEKFIFNSDRFTGDVVPRNYPPKAVAEFLIEKLDKNTALKPFIQAEKAAGFYDTFEIADKFKSFLDGNDAGEQGVLRSIVITRTVGRVGKPEDVEFARKYYGHLVSKLDEQVEFEEFIKLHEILGLGENSKALGNKIKQKLNELETRKADDYSAELQYLKLQGAITQKLNRAEKVQRSKDSILEIRDYKKRLNEEIKAYLSFDYGYLEYLQPWAARRIRRETWASQTEKQTKRNDEMPLKKEVVQAFRGFLNDSKIKSLPAKEKESIRLKILRAIKFFDGELSEQEEEYLTLNEGEQADTLANEGFLLPKQ